MFETIMAGRWKDAEAAYESVRDTCEVFGMDRKTYCSEYVRLNYPPLVITSAGTASTPLRIETTQCSTD